jgi:hypothetical protein
MWQGWTKNLYPLMGGTPKRILAELLEVFPFPEIIGLAFYFWFSARPLGASPGPLLVFVFVAFVVRSLRFGFSLYRNPNPFGSILYYIPGVFLYVAALLSSWWKNTRGRVLWKGRSYPPRS